MNNLSELTPARARAARIRHASSMLAHMPRERLIAVWAAEVMGDEDRPLARSQMEAAIEAIAADDAIVMGKLERITEELAREDGVESELSTIEAGGR